MPEYEVTLAQMEMYVIKVDADTEENAKTEALRLWCAGKDEYHADSIGKIEVNRT